MGVRAVLDQDDPLGARRARRSARPRRRCGRRCGRASPPPAGARRPCARGRRTTCRGRRGCSRRTRPGRRPPGSRAASPMKVFEGQSTVLPRSSKNSSAASAAPVQLRSRPPAARSRPPRPPRSRARSGRPTTCCRRGCRPRARAGARGRGGRSRWRTCRSPCSRGRCRCRCVERGTTRQPKAPDGCRTHI